MTVVDARECNAKGDGSTDTDGVCLLGAGERASHRFCDSWIVNNDIGSTGPNLSVEGGPVRILANHLNGTPRHNIELRGNRSVTIIGNICEGARREVIVYRMLDWLEADSPPIQIVGNNIGNGGKEHPKRFLAIGIQSRDSAYRTSFFTITGNFFACTDEDDDWCYAINAPGVDMLALTGNQWDRRGFSTAPVGLDDHAVAVAGNTSGGTVGGRVVAEVNDATTLTATAGDWVCILSDGASVTLPAVGDNTCRFTLRNVAGGSFRVAAAGRDVIDREASISLFPGQTVEMLCDGRNWWTL